VQDADDAVAADPGPDLEAERTELVRDGVRGPGFAERQLGVAMQIAAQRDELGSDRLGRGVDRWPGTIARRKRPTMTGWRARAVAA